MISGKGCVPSTLHRVWYAHSAGGKETYMNNVPVVPKRIKPVVFQTESFKNEMEKL